MLSARLCLWFMLVLYSCFLVESKCSKGCDLALASYYVYSGATTTSISDNLNASISDILSYNPQIPNKDSLPSDIRINVPFSCDCLNGSYFGHVFKYKVSSGDTYTRVAQTDYSNLTTVDWLEKSNSYPATNIPSDATLNVVVNCSCGNASVSTEYGLFITYPLRPGDTLNSVAAYANISADLVRSYNPDANFSAGSGLVYIPGRDKNGNYVSLTSRTGTSGGSIAGISVGVVAGVIVLAGCVYYGYMRRNQMKKATLLPENPEYQLAGSGSGFYVTLPLFNTCTMLTHYGFFHSFVSRSVGSTVYA